MRSAIRRLGRIIRQDGGSAQIEFALSAMTMLIAIFGTMDIARAAYMFHFVSYAAQEGTRYAMVRGSSWGSASCTSTSTMACNATSTNVQSYVRSLASVGMTSSNLTVTTTWPGTTISGGTCSTTNAAGCLVKVKVSYPFTSFLPRTSLTFAGTSETVIQK